MKVLVFGANGMLGRYVYTFLHRTHLTDEIIPITRDQFNILEGDISSLDRFFESLSPNKETGVVINCMGAIPQRYNMTENEGHSFFRINSEFPHLLAAVAHRHKYQMIHITTDCVYNGLKGNYSEEDPSDETNIYGRSKSLGEPANVTIIRTSIIGEELSNKKSLLEWVRSQDGNTINGFVNHQWNGVTCLQLAKVIFQIIQEKNYWNGVRHIFSPESVSKYELVRLIAETYNLKIQLNPVKAASDADKTLRTIYPENSSLKIPPLPVQLKEQRHYNL